MECQHANNLARLEEHVKLEEPQINKTRMHEEYKTKQKETQSKEKDWIQNKEQFKKIEKDLKNSEWELKNNLKSIKEKLQRLTERQGNYPRKNIMKQGLCKRNNAYQFMQHICTALFVCFSCQNSLTVI